MIPRLVEGPGQLAFYVNEKQELYLGGWGGLFRADKQLSGRWLLGE